MTTLMVKLYMKFSNNVLEQVRHLILMLISQDLVCNPTDVHLDDLIDELTVEKQHLSKLIIICWI